MKNIFRDFIDLFYPSLCICCKNRLVNQEPFICLECLSTLPLANHLETEGDHLEKLFYGRLQLENIACFGYFTKGGKFQKIIHEIKYKNNKDLAIYIGKLCGNKLKDSNFIKDIDYIVPVPLHPNRLKKRGYNQSLLLAQGIAEKINLPIIDNNLIRLKDNDSQTTKSKIERWNNIDKIFEVEDKSVFQNKHILIIDDVITTGATIEICTKTILKETKTQISIFGVTQAIQ